MVTMQPSGWVNAKFRDTDLVVFTGFAGWTVNVLVFVGNCSAE